jgi:hypothetical protein
LPLNFKLWKLASNFKKATSVGFQHHLNHHLKSTQTFEYYRRKKPPLRSAWQVGARLEVALRLNANSHPINGWPLFADITAKCRGDRKIHHYTVPGKSGRDL